MNYYFSADTHFFHKNIIRFCNRPFNNVNEMNSVLVQCWNKVVDKNDIIYFLGDFSFGSVSATRQIRSQLNGEILFIRGSHDKQAIKAFGDMPYIREINIDGQLIVLCHYAMRTWHASHWNSYHLYSHSHGGLKGEGKSMDVGVDTNNYYPYSFAEIKEIMAHKPDNFNYIKKGVNKNEKKIRS